MNVQTFSQSFDLTELRMYLPLKDLLKKPFRRVELKTHTNVKWGFETCLKRNSWDFAGTQHSKYQLHFKD